MADRRRPSDPPRHVRALRMRVSNLVGTGSASSRLEVAITNVVLAQMLPPGAIKGGTAIKLRLGHGKSRFTPDLDFARRCTMDEFIASYQVRLTAGWGGFTGRLVPVTPARPVGLPPAYVMQPYDVKVSYHDASWMTVRLEVGHDEIGDTQTPDMQMAPDLLNVFADLGLPTPNLVPVVTRPHQIAQKLHACSAPDSERAHDLVDLQLLVTADLDLNQVRGTCERLFTSRRQQQWPTLVTPGPDWATIYAAAAADVDCLKSLPEAVQWTNDLVQRIEQARPSN